MITLNESNLKQIIENILIEFRTPDDYLGRPHRYGYKEIDFEKKIKQKHLNDKNTQLERYTQNIILYILKGYNVQKSIDMVYANSKRNKKITVADYANMLNPEQFQSVKDAVKKSKENQTFISNYFPKIVDELKNGKYIDDILSELNITEEYLYSIITEYQKQSIERLKIARHTKKLY